jgi:hypothetical protein
MKSKLLFTVVVLIMTAQMISSQSWVNRPNLPSTARTAVGSFAIGSKGYYIGGETSSGINLVDNWEYDTSSNTWSEKTNYPGTGTQKGVAFSINGLGYYGLGTAGGQLYSYNPQNDTWTQKTTCNIPSINFWSTTYFVIGTKTYFLDSNNKFFYYDSLSDSWTILSDFTGVKRTTAVGFSINDKGYICTGINATSSGNIFLNDLWEYNPESDTWIQKTALPSDGRYASFGFSFNKKGYVLGGETNTGVVTNQFWEYNPINDSWTTLPDYIGGAKNYLSGFVANNSVYAGFGSLGFGVTLNEYGFYNQSSSFCTSLSGSLQNGLIAYWPFCGNANDQSGNGNNGVVNGATLTTDRYGNSNSAYNFTDNQEIIIPNSTNQNHYPLTVSLWYNPSVHPVGNQTNVFSKYVAGSWNGFQILYGDNTSVPNNGTTLNNGFGTQSWYARNISNRVIGYYDSPGFLQPNVSLNTWYHYIFVLDSTGGKIYVDGQLVSSDTWDGTPGVSINNFLWKIGGQYEGNSWYNGKIDDIGVWNRALTQQEITNLFSSEGSNECLTMVINTGVLSTNPITYTSTINIYPNPANDQITIDCGNLDNVEGWSIKITNVLGQEVFNKPMNTQQYIIPLNTWTGQGIYFVKIINAQNQVVNSRKIILQ